MALGQESGFGDVMHKAAECALSKAAKPLMSDLCTRFADATTIDRTLGVMRDVDEVSAAALHPKKRERGGTPRPLLGRRSACSERG